MDYPAELKAKIELEALREETGISNLAVGFVGKILVQMRMNQEEMLNLPKRDCYSRSSC